MCANRDSFAWRPPSMAVQTSNMGMTGLIRGIREAYKNYFGVSIEGSR